MLGSSFVAAGVGLHLLYHLFAVLPTSAVRHPLRSAEVPIAGAAIIIFLHNSLLCGGYRMNAHLINLMYDHPMNQIGKIMRNPRGLYPFHKCLTPSSKFPIFNSLSLLCVNWCCRVLIRDECPYLLVVVILGFEF